MPDDGKAAAAEAAVEKKDEGTGLLAKVDAADPAAKKDADGQGGLGEHLQVDATQKAQAEAAQKRERPSYVPEKFWDKEKNEILAEQAFKSYAELEKNFKHGKHKAPEGGKYDMTVFGDKLQPDDPLNKAYVEWAAKHGISQAAFDELAQKHMEIGAQQMEAEKISYDNELKALGANGPTIIASMVDWARGFVRSGVWSLEDFEEFKVMGGTAQGMRALMKLRESYEGRIPLKDTTPSSDLPSRQELEQMIADPRYQTDEAFRQKVTDGYTRLEKAGALA